MNGTPYTVGIIGCGIIGASALARLADDARVRVTGVADVSLDRANALAARSGANAYQDVDAMLAAERPAIAVLATPDALHREPALAVARARVPHLFLQKPLATTLEDARTIADALEASGTRTYMLYTNRFDFMDLATRYVVQHGLIGDPIHGEARLDDNIFIPLHLWGERSRDWVATSSPAQFLLSHIVDQVRWYFEPAEIRSVYAISQHVVLRHTADVIDTFLFLDNGMKLRIKAEWIKFMEPRVEFYLYFGGSAGSITYNKLPGFNTHLGWRAVIAPDVTWDALEHHASVLRAHGVDTRLSVEHGWSTAAERTRVHAMSMTQNGTLGPFKVLVDAVEEQTDQPASWRPFGRLPSLIDGLRSAEVIAAIHESAASGKETTVPTA